MPSGNCTTLNKPARRSISNRNTSSDDERRCFCPGHIHLLAVSWPRARPDLRPHIRAATLLSSGQRASDRCGCEHLVTPQLIVQIVKPASPTSPGWMHHCFRECAHQAELKSPSRRLCAIWVTAAWARTLLPAVSSGGEKAAIASFPGDTATRPPPTPLFAGSPTV